MDWFTALEAPTQVAIIGVVTAIVAAVAGVAVAIVNNRKAGGGKAEIAALTIDASTVRLVASALEALNVTLTEQIKASEEAGNEGVKALDKLTRELVELRREVRALSDKMRG